ncbi:MAG: hypothetical protein ACU88J_07575 [Gammaproteobacteria bacterium]
MLAIAECITVAPVCDALMMASSYAKKGVIVHSDEAVSIVQPSTRNFSVNTN